MLYAFEMDYSYPEEMVGECEEDRSPDVFDLKVGVRYSKPSKKVYFRFNAPSAALLKLNRLENSALLPLVSPRLAAVLADAASHDVQVLDAVIRAKDGDVSGYKVVNITNVMPVIDRDR